MNVIRKYDYLKRIGRCTVCGKEKAVEGRTRCEKCAAKRREYYYKKKREGLCVDCNKPAKVGVRCEACAKKRREQQARLQRKDKE